MPYVGDDALSARKRRRSDDDDQGAFIELRSSTEQKDYFHHHHHNWPRKVLPLPSKRARFNHHYQHNTTILHEDNDRHNNNSPHRRRHSREQASWPVKPKPHGNSLLAPCHICAHQPKQKAHLDSFALCQGCGEQTCYICIRQCQGWNAEGEGSVLSEQEALSRSFQMRDIDDDVYASRQDEGHAVDEERENQTKEGRSWKARGHQSIICRRCCVEPPGSDGEVACFGCLPTISGS